MNKKGKISLITTICLLLMIGIGFLLIPVLKDLNFGLDLQGGFEILYKVESIDKSKMTQAKLLATEKTLSKRIDSLGVSEPEITIEGNDKIRVKLAGVKDPDEARKQLSTVATLSFRDVDDNLLMASNVLTSGGAKVGQDSTGNPAVSLSVKDKDKFFEVTNKVKDYGNNRNLIVIWLDFDEATDSYAKEGSQCGTTGSNCLSAAAVSQGFASDVIIQGNFTQDEVKNLVDLINSGSLPSKLTEVSSNTVGASFGAETLSTTFIAGVVAIALIIIFLVLMYHYAGFISSVAIMIYIFLVFFTFWLVGGVLTLPGIAALVLGIGMAVDANIVMFSRIRDELYQGRGVQSAIKQGSKSSLSAIVDSNITTLIIAVIMFIFGESSIKGFATMLIITVLVTMFSMVFLTRLLTKLFTKDGFFDDKPELFINVKKKDIPNVSKNEKPKVRLFQKTNFFKYKKPLIIFSIIVIISGLIIIGTKGLHLGIDYQAGTSITIISDKNITEKSIKNDLNKYKLTARDINITDEETSIVLNDALNGEKVKELNTYFEKTYEAKVNIGVVSNIVQKELVKNAIYAVIISLIGIILYISMRFKYSYALGGVAALIHDVLIIFTVFAVTRLEVSSMFIAALLAVIGYSINDTIIVFDRIREEIDKYDGKLDKEKIEELTNKAIQNTFSRTCFTSITTLIPIITLIILGSSGILTFNIAMLVGLISGTYSSIVIASVIFMELEKKNLGKPKKKKKVYRDDLEEMKVKGVNC